MKILFIQTSWTIDKYYPVVHNTYGFEMGDPAFSSILKNAMVEMDFDTPMHPLILP